MAKCVFVFLVLTLLILHPGISYSQFVVQNGASPQFLVENVLLGNGVSVTNVSYTGSTLSLGSFTQTSPGALGMSSGIVLSTGRVTDLASANNVPNMQYNTQGGSDAQLQSLAPMLNIYDAAVLEFDFIPTTDSIQFKFVFGSEEYAEWVGSNFNDVFGFFVSGPNPNGGQYINNNIALVPGSNTPISTNTINNGLNNLGPCTNCNYYIDNSNSSVLQLDGLTTVLMAKLKVIPCQVYHIKIAIGDGSDHSYDSGVFLEANSFTSLGLHINTTFYNNSQNNIINEGCDSAAIDFVLSNSLAFDYWIPVTYTGSAQNGIDFQNLPDSVFIPAGSDSVRVYILPIVDNISEGIENLNCIIPISGCNFDTVSIRFEDYNQLSSSIIGDSIYCQQNQITQYASVNGGVQPYNYQWNNTISTNSISFVGQQDTSIQLTVTDGCGNSFTSVKNINVNPNPYVSISASIDSACKGDFTVLKAYGASTYSWYKNNLLISNNTDSLVLYLVNSSNIKVVGQNQFGCSSEAIRNLIVYTPMNLTATPTLNTICEGDTASFILGGADHYIWTNNSIVNHNQNYSNVDILTSDSDTLWVKGVDMYSCTDSVALSIIVQPNPQINLQSTYDTLCSNMMTTLTASGAINYQWWSSQSSIPIVGSSINVSPSNSIDYYVKGTDLQSCSNIDTIHLEVYDKPNVYIKEYGVKGICNGDSIQLFAGGTNFYYWINGGNVIANNTNTITLTPHKTTLVSAVGVDVFGCRDTADAIVHVYPEFELKTLDTVVCKGAGANVSVASPSINILNFAWNNGDNNISTDYTVLGPTKVIVTVSDTAGCQNSDSLMLNVFPTTTYNLSPSNQTICLGDTALVIGVNTSELDTFWWNENAIWKSYNNDSIKLIPTSDMIVKSMGIDSNGCNITASASANITVNSLPNIQLSPHYAEVQQMSPYTMTVSGGVSYLWGPVAAILQATSSNSFVIATDTLTHFYVRGVDSNGCVNYDTAIINPRPQLKINTLNRQICFGDSTYLEANTVDSCTYQWSTGEQTKGIWVKPNTTTIYSVSVVDGLGYYNSKSISIDVYTKPHLTTNPSPVYVCKGGSTEIHANGAKYYSWYPSNYLNKTIGSSVITNTPNNTVYKLVGVDKFGCSDSIHVQVYVVPNAAIHISNNYFNICKGQSINIFSTGAATYRWTPGKYLDDSLQSSVVATPDHNTTFTVVGTSIYGCRDTLQAKVIVRPSPNISINHSFQDICLGDSTLLKVHGAKYFSWSPALGLNSLTDSITFAKPNTSTIYTVVGTNKYGCKDSVLTQIGVHAYPNVNISPTYTQVCPNDSAVLTAIGASTYTWYPSLYLDTNKGTSVISKPDTTITYRLIGKTEFGCADTTWKTINVLPLSRIYTAKKHICEGDTVVLNAYSNINNVSYQWSNGGTASQISIVPNHSQWAHLHTSMSNGCSSDTSFYIDVEANPNVSISTNNPIICSGTNVHLHANGAVIYSWTSDSNNINMNGSDLIVSQNTFNTYYLEGRTLLGCKDTASISIGTFQLPHVSVSPNFANICSGSSQLLKSFGAMSYSWYPNIGLSANYGDSVVVLPNTNMTYMVVGTDSNGCMDTAYANFVTLAPATIIPSNPNICLGDSILLSSVSQNQPNCYVWNTGDSTSSIMVSPVQTTNYKLTVNYNIGCSKVSNTNVIVHHDSAVIAQTITPQICHGDTAIMKAINGSLFSWQGSGVINANDSVMFAVPSQNGWYKVSAFSANSCYSQDSVFVSLYNKPPINLSSNVSSICVGDTLQLTASGGTTYKWLLPNTSSTLANISVPVTSTNKYKVIGYDYNLCRDTAEIIVQANHLPSINISPDNPAVCPHDSLLIHIIGNNTYSWNTSPYISVVSNNDAYVFPQANTFFSITSVDSLGCTNDTIIRCDVKREPINYFNFDSTMVCLGDSVKVTAIGASNYFWSPSPYIANYTNDTVYYKPQYSGFYKIMGTSSDGCSKTDSIQIVVYQKPSLSILSNKSSYCFGDSIELLASCSNISSSYLWQNGDTSSFYKSIIDTNSVFKLIGTSVYGCQDSTKVSFVVHNRPSIAINSTDATICQGDTVYLLGVGDSTLSYSWSTGAHTMATFDSPNASLLYSLIAVDSNSCSDTAYSFVNVQALPNIAIIANNTSICEGDSISLGINYTDSSLVFLWNTGENNSNIIYTPTISSLYSVKATDSIGCSNIDSIFVIVNSAPQFSFSPSNPEVCNGDSIILSIVSNNGNLDYLWGVGDTVASIIVSPTTSSDYYATIIDTNGCQKTDTVNVRVNPLPFVNVGVVPPVLCYGDTAILEVNASLSVNQYYWSTGDSSNIIYVNPISNTVYFVTVTDTNFCSNSTQVNVRVVPLPLISISASDSVICSYDTVNLSVSSTIPLDNVLWNTGQTTYHISDVPLTNIVYTVMGIDTNACKAYDSTLVVVNQRPSCEIIVDTSICQGDSTLAYYYGSATNNGVFHWSYDGSPLVNGGGMGPLSLLWNQAGLYKVRLYVDDFACTSFPDSVYVKVNPLPIVDFEVKNSHNCDSSAVSFVNNNFGMMKYFWDFGDPLSHLDTSSMQNPSYVYSVPGSYDVNLKLTTFAGCSANLTKNSIVEVFPKPNAEFRVNTYSPNINHPIVNFYNYSTQYNSLKWSFGEPASGIYNSSYDDNPYHVYLGEGDFPATLVVNNDFNCYDTASTIIHIASEPTLYAATAFTPNGDGLNETFRPVFSKQDVSLFEIYIYNRWGRLVYHSQDYQQGWDGRDYTNGKECEPNVFSYVVYITDSKNTKRKFTGSFTLLR